MTNIPTTSAMRRLILIAAILCIILLRSSASAQTDSVSIPRFRILLTSGARFSGQNGTLHSGLFTFSSDLHKNLQFQTQQILEFEQLTGSYKSTGAAIGLVVGTLIGLGAMVDHSHQEYGRTPEINGVTFAKCVGVGMVAGLFVGSLVPKWEPVRLPVKVGQFGATHSTGISLAVNL